MIPARPLYALCTVYLVLTFALTLFPPNTQKVLSAPGIDQELGHAFVVSPLSVGFPLGLLELRTDSYYAPSESSLQVFEDGRPLGPPHAPHDAIRTEGGGRYSHWNDSLYFSTSDNTDPKTNQRTYEVFGPLAPARWMYGVGFALIVLAAAHRYLSAEGETQKRVGFWLRLWFESTKGMNLPRWLTGIVVLAGALAGPIAVLIVWRSGATISLALAGFLPLSDGAGYLWCANDLVDRGTTIDWCHRRPIYTVFLSSLLMVLGRDLHLVLLIQAAILSLAVVAFIREVSRWLGILFGLLAGMAAVYLIRDYALNQLMTEVMGFSLGILAITIFLRAGELRSLALAIVGLVVLSVAMNARAGAFFAVPTVLLWIVWIAWQKGGRCWRFLAVGVVAAVSGFALHGLLVSIVGGDPGSSHGNFALTLYGHSVGGDWGTIYADHPELFSRESGRLPYEITSGDNRSEKVVNAKIYDLAISNIISSPVVFGASLYKNLRYYFDRVVLGSIPNRWPILDSSLLWIMAVLATAWRARWDPRSALVLALSAGEIASAPLIAIDGGVRVFAVTAAHQILPVAVLAHALITASFRVPPPDGWMSNTESRRQPKMAIAIVLAMALLMVPSITPLRNLARAPMQSGTFCAPEFYTIVTRLRSGGPWLSITPNASVPEVWPRRISPEDLRRGLSPHAWFAESVTNLPPISILIVRQHYEKDYGSERWLYYSGGSELPADENLIICVDRTESVTIAERPFWRVDSFRKL